MPRCWNRLQKRDRRWWPRGSGRKSQRKDETSERERERFPKKNKNRQRETPDHTSLQALPKYIYCLTLSIATGVNLWSAWSRLSINRRRHSLGRLKDAVKKNIRNYNSDISVVFSQANTRKRRRSAIVSIGYPNSKRRKSFQRKSWLELHLLTSGTRIGFELFVVVFSGHEVRTRWLWRYLLIKPYRLRKTHTTFLLTPSELDCIAVIAQECNQRLAETANHRIRQCHAVGGLCNA